MNRADFDARYELIEQVTEGAIETHHALHRSGVVVMVHFVGDPSLQDEVHRSVGRLQAAGAEGQIVDVQRIDERVVVVTRFIMDFVSLSDWFSELGAPMAEPPAFGDPLSPRSGGGEFTRLFAVEAPGEPETTDDEQPAGAASAESVSDQVPPDEAARGADTAKAVDSGPEPAVPSGESDPPAGPGEFTRMFQALPKNSDDQTVPLTPPASPPPASPSPPSASPPPHPASPPPDTGPPQAGEFTRMFQVERPTGTPSKPGSHEASGPSSGDPSTAPDSRPGSGPSDPRSDTPSTDAPSDGGPTDAPQERGDSGTPPDQAPGEFTRFFQGIQPKGSSDGQSIPSPTDEPFPWAGFDDARPDEPRLESPKAPHDQWAEALRSDRRPPSKPPPHPDPVADPGPSGTPRPGGFTQMFGAQAPPPPTGSGSSAAGPSPSGSPGSGSVPPPPTPPPAVSPPADQGASSAGSAGSLLGGGKPRMPRARIPDPEALIRGARPRPPRAPRLRAPTGRKVARAAVGAALAGVSGAAGGGPESSSDDENAPRKGLSTKAFAIGLTVIIVLSVVVVALLTFGVPGSDATSSDPAAGDAPVADSATTASPDSTA